jgi:hypothetical protein
LETTVSIKSGMVKAAAEAIVANALERARMSAQAMLTLRPSQAKIFAWRRASARSPKKTHGARPAPQSVVAASNPWAIA